jgi:hypothetical protein
VQMVLNLGGHFRHEREQLEILEVVHVDGSPRKGGEVKGMLLRVWLVGNE